MAKYLLCFIYFFIAIGFQRVNGAVFQCQNEEIEINCPFGQQINITNAFYGSDNNTICPKGNKTVSPSPPSQPCSLANATFIVAEKCNRKERCTIAVNSTIFGNTCPEKSTYLQVNFTCNTSLKCGEFEHVALGECNCRQFCPSYVRCFPTCPLQYSCVCNDGYLRDGNTGNCVLAQYCPNKGNPNQNHEEYCECANRQKTCRNPSEIAFLHYSCFPGYACKKGYIRDTYTNTCVLPGECPRPYRRWK